MLEDELIRCPAHTSTNAKVKICHSISCSANPGEDLKLTMGIPASLGKQREQLKLKKSIVNQGNS